MRCEIISTATPRARSRSTTSSSRCVAASESELVASSRISSRDGEETARAISTSCWSSTLSSPTGAALVDAHVEAVEDRARVGAQPRPVDAAACARAAGGR